MNYVNYDTSIVERYKVKLRGWPSGVKFTNPSEIGTMNEIRALRDALKNGECIWVSLSKREQEGHSAMLQD